MTTDARRWPVVVPTALSLLAAVELAAYLLLGPVTTGPDGTTAGALAAGNAFLVGFAAVVVGAAAVGVAGAVGASPRSLWLPAAAVALLGVVGIAVGPQVLVVALLLVLAALLAEATPDGRGRRDGPRPPPERGRATGAAASVAESSPAGVPPRQRTADDATDGSPLSASEPGPGTVGRAVDDGSDRKVLLAAALLVPLAALLGVTVLTTPVARPAVAATAAVVLAGAALSVRAAWG